ncbi:hypothetical protein XENOCAPTIV_014512, partial [Xenoophorus captivus]
LGYFSFSYTQSTFPSSIFNLSCILTQHLLLLSISHLVQGDDCLLVHSGDVEGVPRLPLQDGVFQLGVLTEVCIGCGDASNLCTWDGKFGNREGPHAWEQRHDGTH